MWWRSLRRKMWLWSLFLCICHIQVCSWVLHLLLCVLCDVCTSLGLNLSALFDSILWVCGLYEFTVPSIFTVRNIWKCRGKEPRPRLWFNMHTPTDQGLGECMCWWKSNVLCLQGTACFSLSLLSTPKPHIPYQPETSLAKNSSPKCFPVGLSLSPSLFL